MTHRLSKLCAIGITLAVQVCLAPAALAWETRARASDPVDTVTVLGAGGDLQSSLSATPDLPTTGRSAFDALFTTMRGGRQVYDVPYPFSRLLDRVARDLGSAEREGGPALKSVLIPFSRCIDRSSAPAHNFRRPRVVVAVDNEPRTRPARGTVLIKDRLFIGHQERSRSIQVISYNETAGRFEFQTVSDYGPGGKPRVRYARRARCMACHQNAGPIFAKPPWDETNINPEIAERLARAGGTQLSRSPHLAGPQPYAVSRAASRAGLYGVYQRVWRDACGEDTAAPGTILCRAGALELMLAQRLSILTSPASGASLSARHFLPVIVSRFRERWPRGIAARGTDIPNRRPLTLPVPWAIPRALDPAKPRDARLRYRLRDMPRLMRGLADMLPLADLRRLDEHLFRTAIQRRSIRWQYRGPCQIRKLDDGWRNALISLECHLRDGNFGRSFDVLGDLGVSPTGLTNREGLDRFLLFDGTYFMNVIHTGGQLRAGHPHTKVTLDLFRDRDGLHAWLPDGTVVQRLEIRWPNGGGRRDRLPPDGTFPGDATLTIMPGYGTLSAALEEMAGRAQAGRLEALSGHTFRGTRILQALMDTLSLPRTGWCCEDWTSMPPMVLADASAGPPANAVGLNRGSRLARHRGSGDPL